ncbi:hypothetical protein [Niallia sp. RD1]|nr:hypothetical protein [Niallia sp. RD1]
MTIGLYKIDAVIPHFSYPANTCEMVYDGLLGIMNLIVICEE